MPRGAQGAGRGPGPGHEPLLLRCRHVGRRSHDGRRGRRGRRGQQLEGPEEGHHAVRRVRLHRRPRDGLRAQHRGLPARVAEGQGAQQMEVPRLGREGRRGHRLLPRPPQADAQTPDA